MDISRVKVEDLTEDYVNAHYYSPRFLENERKLESCRISRRAISAISTKCNCGATPKNVDYTASGQGLIRTSDVRPNRFDGEKVLRSEALKVRDIDPTAAVAGDLLFTMSGSVGYAAVIPQTEEVFSFSNTIARVRFANDGEFNSRFVAAYFNSQHGYLQSTRLTSGGIQGHVMPNPFKRLKVVSPTRKCQDFVGGKIELSERLAKTSIESIQSARDALAGLFSQFVGGNQTQVESESNHSRISADSIEDRIDGWYYRPAFLSNASLLSVVEKGGKHLVPIQRIGKVQYGFMPTEDYWTREEGAPLLRVTNIKENLIVDVSNLEYVNPTLSNKPRYRLRANDVLCVQCGNSTGRIGFVTSSLAGMVFPSFCLRITDIDSAWDPAFLACFLSSERGQLQIQRTVSITSVRPNTTKPAIESVVVPRYKIEEQKVVGDLVRRGTLLREAVTPLCMAATLLVEGLIDRRLSEGELADAQSQLESGDQSGDRVILSRLYEGGIDATDTRPLFPDLDAYYQTLQMAEQAMADGGDE